MKISVIIPTHNRCASLLRTLQPLCAAPELATSGEVIVVADGCSDSTAADLRARRWPWALRVLEQTPGRGAAAARNAGAAVAQGRMLLFLDDDIEPRPGLIQRHLDAHCSGPRAVVGGYPPALEGPGAPVHVLKRDWWLGRFHEMAQPGHRFNWRDLLSGNLSMPAALFQELGGFDEGIGSAGGEDYEFGIRLVRSGAELSFEPRAVALHHEHETTDLARYMSRARQEGLADVRIAKRHPSVRYALPLWHRHPRGRKQRIARAAAWVRGRSGELFPLALTPLLHVAGTIGAQRGWLRVCGALHEYWYWRGVREAVGDRDALENLLADSVRPEGSELELDLAAGLHAAERAIDEARPDGLRLRYGSFAVGRIAPEAATEPLRGGHLRRLLATDLAWPLLKAKAAHEALEQDAGAHPMENENGHTAAFARAG